MPLEVKEKYFINGDGGPVFMASKIASMQESAEPNVGDALDSLLAAMFCKNDTDDELIADLDYVIDQLQKYRANAKLSAVYGG